MAIDPVAFARDHYSRIAHFHFKDTLPVWSAGKGWKGRHRARKRKPRWPKSSGFRQTPDPIYQRLGTGGVEFPALIRSCATGSTRLDQPDFNYVDMPPGVTIEQDMAAHRKYLVETLHASLKG